MEALYLGRRASSVIPKYKVMGLWYKGLFLVGRQRTGDACD